MAEKNRATLKSYFETGDRPTQENFADLVDSFVSRTDDSFVTILPDASTAQKGIARQAAIADVQAGTNSQYFVTPEGAKIAAQTFAPVTSVNGQTGAITITAPPVPDASTTVKGIVQQATTADVQAGTNTQLYVTPAGAKTAAQTFAPVTSVNAQTGAVVIADASTTVKGIVQRATVADAQAGTNTLLYVTPEGAKTAAQTFAPVKSVNGQTGVVTIPVVQDSGWVNITLVATFTNFGAPNEVARYRKKGGVVYLEGAIKGGAAGGTITTLPVGFRPANTITFIASTSSATPARITIASTGVVTGAAINTTFTSLSGIVFVVE
jgi:hypothetical protein